MKSVERIIMIFLLLMLAMSTVAAKDGYSDYDTERTGAEGEESDIQYGYALPAEWSEWSRTRTNDPFEVRGKVEVEHYAYSDRNRQNYWYDAGKKELFTWNFGESSRIVRIYLDVDTYVNKSYTNYIGPPLHVYCDGRELTSIGWHDHLKNFDYRTDCECSILKVTMDDGGGSGRNTTNMVGSWVTIERDQYRHVIRWDDGHDWRFTDPYDTVYGEEPRLPVEREVFRRPVIYRIDYELDGGEFLSEPVREYRVIDEIVLERPVKKGYDFIGFDNNGTIIDIIPKGTTGDLKLTALWDRKDPAIWGPVKGYRQNEEYSMADVLIGARAEDELEGDISEKIRVSQIRYEDGRTISKPSSLDTSEVQKIYVTYEVENSDGKKASVEKIAYILGKGDVLKKGSIYPRYISEKYDGTLDPGSLWRKDDYREKLSDVYRLLEVK